MPDPIQAAIARGDATSRLLIKFRDALFEPAAGLLLIAGPEGLHACMAGVAEAVIQASRKPYQVGDDALLDRCIEADRTVIGFPGEGEG